MRRGCSWKALHAPRRVVRYLNVSPGTFLSLSSFPPLFHPFLVSVGELSTIKSPGGENARLAEEEKRRNERGLLFLHVENNVVQMTKDYNATRAHARTHYLLHRMQQRDGNLSRSRASITEDWLVGPRRNQSARMSTCLPVTKHDGRLSPP